MRAWPLVFVLAFTVLVPATGAAAFGTRQPPPAQAADAGRPDMSPPAVNAGRPTLTDPAALTAPGWLETEFGIFQNLNRDRAFGTPLLFKLTSSNRRLEYRLSTDGYVRLED